MATINFRQNLILLLFFVVFCLGIVLCDSIVSQSGGKPCTYFAGARVSSAQLSLVNCSWYSNNACCKRTEVTSVFGGMYPLFGASKDCKNRMNYMMCYFCSPDQYRWYNKKAYVCEEFCDLLYQACQNAEYKGEAIGEKYPDGAAFCRGQKFEVVEPGEGNCFDFDPLVFGKGARIQCGIISMFVAFFLLL